MSVEIILGLIFLFGGAYIVINTIGGGLFCLFIACGAEELPILTKREECFWRIVFPLGQIGMKIGLRINTFCKNFFKWLAKR